jgi:hypothetical protein
MQTLTYIGPGGQRTFTTEDGFSVDLAFTRGEPVEISDENAKHLLSGPHAREFVEGELEEQGPSPEAPPAAGAITDETGDVPGSDDDDTADQAEKEA